MSIRLSKIALVSSVALFCTLVAFNNITDYNSNFMFVQHVLSMDTTFPDNKGMWRSITSPALHHAAYVLIIFTEVVVAVLCWSGAFKLWRNRADARAFDASKGLAATGLTLGIVLWFAGFVAVGGEWFLMWQSQVWNGQESSIRFAVILGIVLIYLSLPEHQAVSGDR